MLLLLLLAMFSGLRGGAGVNPSWHRSGRGLNKLNSIHDFVSCGEYLINEGLIHKNQLSALGISAGCLLVGAAVNMHPELFSAAILKVKLLQDFSPQPAWLQFEPFYLSLHVVSLLCL